MSDFNKPLVSKSPQIRHSIGNNENETENQRNLPPKNKHFMSPTVSAAAKFTPTPKKKVFSEWKLPEWKSPKSLPKVPKSVVHSPKITDNFAIIDDSFDVPYDPLTNYLSPRPRFLRYRPKRRLEIVDKSDSDSLTDSVESSSTLACENEEILTNDEKSVVDENELDDRPRRRQEIVVKSDGDSLTDSVESSSTLACENEEILTNDEQSVVDENELDDRPKRRREIVVKSDSDSLTDSVEGSSTLACENEEILTNDERSVVDENELDEEFEFEEDNSGFRWVLVKFLMVCLGLVFGTMWISCMNSSVPRLEISGFRLVDGNVVNMNMSLRIVSLSSLDYGKMDVFELDEKVGLVDQISEISDVEEINGAAFRDGQAVFDEGSVALESMTEHNKVETEVKIDDSEAVASVIGTGVENVVLDSETEHEPDETEAPIEANASVVVGSGIENVVLDSETECEPDDIEEPIEANASVVVGTGVENVILDSKTEREPVETQAPIEAYTSVVVGSGMENVHDSKTEHEQVEIEAPIHASVVNEWPGLDDLVVSEVKFRVSEAHGFENATEVSDEAIEAEISKDFRTVQTEYDQVEIVAPMVVPGMNEESDVKSKEGELSSELEVVAEEKQSETVESERFRLTFRELLWPVITPFIALGLLASLLFKFYCKCKRVSSRSRSSYVKLSSTVGKTAKIKPGLPPRALEKTAHSEVKPPSSINPQEHLDMDSIDTVIPRVKQLGEFEVGVEFTQSLKRCSAKTEMEPSDETVFFTPNTKRMALRRASFVQPSSSEMSTADSYSRGSDISHDRTFMKDVKEEVMKATPTPRRSTRLRNKGLTSP